MPRPIRAAGRWRALAILLPLLGTLTIATPPPVAAAGGLVVLAQTRYVVLPAENRVHVTVDAVATSFEPDTAQGRTYYSGARFAVQPGVSNVSATSGGAPIGAAISRREEGFAVIDVTFGRRVFYRQSYAYTVSFDLADPGGHGTGDLRIGHSLAALPIWAFGSEATPGSSVRVELPQGFQPDLQGDEMLAARGGDGGTILSAEPADPFTFFAYLTADRPGAFRETEQRVDVHGTRVLVVVRAWDDDRPWGRRIGRLIRLGLPELQRLIGVDYAGRGPLTVEEAATSRLGEYAGVYDPITGVIRVRYDADAWVALHEAAHVWFNGQLFRDRWIGEAFAEFYGVQAGKGIGASGRSFELTDELLRSRIPLNDWGGIGVESLEVEDFAYAATYTLAQRIAARTQIRELRPVWVAAANREMSYQPAHGGDPQKGVSFSAEDWQRLLDLLEERTGEEYADLWSRWVVNDDQRPLLAERGDARNLYQQTVEQAGDWELPASIRRQMGAWTFGAATVSLEQAGEVLAQRDDLRADARALGLDLPPTLRATFEDDLDAAEDEAAAEVATLVAIERATAATAHEPSLLETIGTLGSDPRARVREAGEAFEAGDLPTADSAAEEALAADAGAADAGRLRVAVAGGGVLLLDGTWMALMLSARRRRRRLTSVAA